VAISGQNFDIGGRVEMMYGGDARFIHANGLFDNHDDDPTGRIVPGPRAQFDLTQAYADINLPVGNGIRVRAGKFTYFKQTDPNAGANFNAILPGTLGGAGVKPGTGGTAMWYGLSGYAVQRLTDQFSLAGRAEFYRDQDGYTTGVAQTLWEATVGVIITPFPN